MTGGGWLDRLPRLAGDLLDDWRLRPTGHVAARLLLAGAPGRGRRRHGRCAEGRLRRRRESLHEGLALQHWGGRGADGSSGPTRDDARCCWTAAGAGPRRLLGRRGMRGGRRALRPAPHPGDAAAGRRLVVRRAVAARARRAGPRLPVPRRYVDQALSLGPDLLAHEAASVVVHGDLHYANVMADDAGERLAIDPKPMAGDPHYEPAPMLWNRMDELSGPGAVGSGATACAAASTRWSTPPASTRRAPATGWSCGWCSTRGGRCRTRSAPIVADGGGAGLDHPLHRLDQGRPGLTKVESRASDGTFAAFATAG